MDFLHAPGHPPLPARLPITDISQWVERFSIMVATLVTRFPEKGPELFAYQAQIVRAERNYEPGRWVVYDANSRERPWCNWFVTDTHKTFTGRARVIPRCQLYLQDDHSMAGVVPASYDHVRGRFLNCAGSSMTVGAISPLHCNSSHVNF